MICFDRPQKPGFFERLLFAAFPDARKEYRFDKTRKWRVDYYLPIKQIAVEIEGGVWIAGRHTRPTGYLRDIEKYNALCTAGIRLYRIPAPDARKESKAVQHVQALVRA